MLRFRLPAPEYTIFAPGAFDGDLGKVIKFDRGWARIIEIEIVDEGRAAEFTLDTLERTN